MSLCVSDKVRKKLQGRKQIRFETKEIADPQPLGCEDKVNFDIKSTICISPVLYIYIRVWLGLTQIAREAKGV